MAAAVVARLERNGYGELVRKSVLSRACRPPPYSYWSDEDDLAQLRALGPQEAGSCGLPVWPEDHRQWCEQQWSGRRWRGKRREAQRRQRQDRRGQWALVRGAQRACLQH